MGVPYCTVKKKSEVVDDMLSNKLMVSKENIHQTLIGGQRLMKRRGRCFACLASKIPIFDTWKEGGE